MSCPPLLCVLYLSVALLAAPLSASEHAELTGEDDLQKQAAQERKERFTNWMREFAENTKIVTTKSGVGDQPAELVPHPVFRYSDEQRFIPDATLWVWTVDGRPAAFQKVEGNNHGGGQMWTICFASLSEHLVKVTWPLGREFQAQKPGVAFKPIPDAESPSDKPGTRTRQMKMLKDRISGRLGPGANQGGGAETRFMAKPIFEYTERGSTLARGAIFGMSATGTNPDLLLLIEARRDAQGKLRWEYACARMTAEPLVVRLDKTEVWSESSSGANNIAPGNWIYFFLPRSFELPLTVPIPSWRMHRVQSGYQQNLPSLSEEAVGRRVQRLGPVFRRPRAALPGMHQCAPSGAKPFGSDTPPWPCPVYGIGDCAPEGGPSSNAEAAPRRLDTAMGMDL